jgi:hypothetical protein
MSLKEPALRLLRERFSETFALTKGNENQIHLFLIKYGMWALVRTLVPKDIHSQKIGMSEALILLENALNESGTEELLLASLDASVDRARARIETRRKEFGIAGDVQKGI